MLGSGLVVTLLVAVSNAVLPLPSYIKPCARSDPNFNSCALEHAKETFPYFVKGDRKYHIPRMDPLHITEIAITDGHRQSGFSLILRDVKMYGLKDALILKTEFDFNKRHVLYDTKVPLLTILGKYEIFGRVLLLPITGKGDMNITLIGNTLTYSYDYDLVDRDGTAYQVTKNQKTVVEPTKAQYRLTNLFNGDKMLGKQTNEIANENWKEVYKSMSPAVTEAFSEAIGIIVNNIDSTIPFDVVFPETIP